jgi:hypothetical protein
MSDVHIGPLVTPQRVFSFRTKKNLQTAKSSAWSVNLKQKAVMLNKCRIVRKFLVE